MCILHNLQPFSYSMVVRAFYASICLALALPSGWCCFTPKHCCDNSAVAECSCCSKSCEDRGPPCRECCCQYRITPFEKPSDIRNTFAQIASAAHPFIGIRANLASSQSPPVFIRWFIDARQRRSQLCVWTC